MKPMNLSTPNALDQIVNEAKDKSTEYIRDEIVKSIYQTSKSISKQVVHYKNNEQNHSEKLDRIFTSPIWGFPIMLLMLGAVFYLTIAGANVPSSMIAEAFSWVWRHN